MRQADDYARACGIGGDVTIGDRAYRVGKLAPRDMAELQTWFKTIVEDPRKAAVAAINADPDMDEEAARILWVEAATSAFDYPPQIGTELAAILLDADEGRARFLWVALRQHQPDVTLEVARELAELAPDDTHTRIFALAMPGEIGDIKPPPSGGTPPSYREIRAELCKVYGWTFDIVDAMPFELIHDALNAGKTNPGRLASGAEARDMVERWRDYVVGL